MNPRIFEANSAAPALNRGLALLAMLDGTPPLSLEDLSRKSKLPKASVFRLLGALQDAGLVQKTPEKCYEALFALRPLKDAAGLFRDRMEKKMSALCRKLAVTVEWYEPSAEGMKLIRQAHPDSELRVQAKPGFVRQWGGELDAVARLGYAFAPQAPAPGKAFRYAANGVTENLPARRTHALREAARESQSAADDHFNTNGVRRCAVATREGAEFRGVLAVAEAFHFSPPGRPGHFLAELKQTLRTL